MIGLMKFMGLKNLALIAAVAFVGLMVWSYEADKRRLAALEQVLVQKDAEIYLLKRTAEQKQKAIESANKVRKELEHYKQAYIDIHSGIKGKEDGEVAPVLRDTLDAIGRMQRKDTH